MARRLPEHSFDAIELIPSKTKFFILSLHNKLLYKSLNIETLVRPKYGTAVLSGGPFGPADLVVTNPGFQTPGFERIVLRYSIRYGLTHVGKAMCAETAPKFMVRDGDNFGKLIYTSGGFFNDGNRFLYPAEVAGLESPYGSFYTFSFDVSDPTDPVPAGGRSSSLSQQEINEIQDQYDNNPNSVLNPSRAPDSRGITVANVIDAIDQLRKLLLVASGDEGLTVLDLNASNAIIATDSGSGLASNVTGLDNLALVSQSGGEDNGSIGVFDLSFPKDPIYLESFAGGASGTKIYKGKLFALNAPIKQPDNSSCGGDTCPEIPTPLAIGEPEYPSSRFSGTFGDFAATNKEEYEDVSGTVSIIDLENPNRPVINSLAIDGAAVDMNIKGNLLAVAAETGGFYLNRQD